MASAASESKSFASRSLEAIVVAGFISMLLLLSGSAWLSVADINKMKAAISWVDHTHEVTEMLKELELDVREAEAALRTYIITGDAFEEEEYRRQAFGEMPNHMKEMRRLCADNPAQQRILDRMEPLLKERVALMEKAKETYESSQTKALDQSGAKLTNKILTQFAAFVALDQDLLTAHISAREARASLVTSAIIGGGALGLGCVSVSLFIILRGLRQRRQTGKELLASLAEKEILLKEVHHRVKNNLQVISSLLSLQSEKVKDPKARIVFRECRDRIHSMARLHQQLYTQGHFASVDFGKHLQEMAAMLVRSHSPSGCEVALSTQNEPIRLNLDLAITLGLIANELILNVLKHAFSGRGSGSLCVSLCAGREAEMTIADDGVGLPSGFDPEQSGGLGLELVRGLTQQIHGSAVIVNHPGGGTSSTIRFPLGDLEQENLKETSV